MISCRRRLCGGFLYISAISGYTLVKEEWLTVKGISKQVILVRPRNGEPFEQAIFILRDDARDLSDRELLRQAREAAEQERSPRSGRIQRSVAFLVGLATATVLYLLPLLL